MKNLIKRDLKPVRYAGTAERIQGRNDGQARWQEGTPRRETYGGAQSDPVIAESSNATDTRNAPDGPRICLVVDDSRMIRKVARRIVSGLGFTVLDAENGEEALALCRKAVPALVLTDWDMPVMTGLDFVASLRALPDGEHAKVVFCTSKSSALNIHDGIAAGADEYVVKPFDELGLRRKLDNLGLL